MKRLFRWLLLGLAGALLGGFGLLLPKRRRELIWTPMPIISSRYWSRAMRAAGWRTRTLMSGYYDSINRREDYDTYFDDLLPKWIRPAAVRVYLAPIVALLFLLRNAKVVHLPFSGGPLGETPLWRLEGWLFRRAGIKTVVIPYGADAYMYSRIADPCIRLGLLASYPGAARRESEIAQRVDYWVQYADCVIAGLMLDGIGRSDIATPSFIQLDTDSWTAKNYYTEYDGTNGPVRVLHTPNHRGFKGTEFLVRAVEELRSEGLQLELVLLERVPNERVREIMATADVLVEQLLIGYALSAIEGMACGLPVISNLEHEFYTRVYRRYSFLNECPIVSASPETIKDSLRVLVRNPPLREELGRAGRAYVEKYHSYATAQYMFGAIYRNILEGEDVPLIDLFHPLKSEFVGRSRPVQHPLKENHWNMELELPQVVNAGESQ